MVTGDVLRGFRVISNPVQAWTLKLQNKTLGQFYSIVDGAKDIKIIVDVESEESLERRNEK